MQHSAADGADVTAVVRVPPTDIADGGECAWGVRCVRGAPVKGPRVTYQDVADIQRYSFQPDFTFGSRHPVCAGGDFNGTVLRPYPDEAEADYQHVSR